MKIVMGLRRGRIGENNRKLMTQSVHIADEDRDGFTLCGVDVWKSQILTPPIDGKFEQANCKKCLKKHASQVSSTNEQESEPCMSDKLIVQYQGNQYEVVQTVEEIYWGFLLSKTGKRDRRKKFAVPIPKKEAMIKKT